MTNLLEFKEWMRNFYSKFSLYINAAMKFITMLVVTLLINNSIGFMGKLNSPVTALILAMLSAFLPVNVMVLFSAGLILIHLYSVSLELAAIVLMLFLIILLVYYRFAPKYAYALLLTAVAFALKVPFLVPVILGMTATPVTMIPVCFGGIVYFLLKNISAASLNLFRVEDESTTQAYLLIVENTIKSSQMYLWIITAMVTILVVYVIRRMSVDHSWNIAIFTGVLLDLLVFLIGDFMLDISNDILSVIPGAIISLAVAFILQFFVFSVDYTRTEHVQFEDDEYYYYVKAVPKMTITKREKEVKRINPQKKVREDKKKSVSADKIKNIKSNR